MKKIMFKIYSADPSGNINISSLFNNIETSYTARNHLLSELGHISDIAFNKRDYSDAVGVTGTGHSNDRYRSLS